MSLAEMLLDSWDRQCQIVTAVASRVTEQNRHAKPSPDGFSLAEQLCHMHGVRRYFLSQVAPRLFDALGGSITDDEGTPHPDLEVLRQNLRDSGAAVRQAVKEALERGGPMRGENVTYDNAVLFLQHMVWHDGWHVGLIMLALRLNGDEPPEEWEEAELWGLWRTECW